MGNEEKPVRIRFFDWVRAAEIIKMEEADFAEAFIWNEEHFSTGVIFADGVPRKYTRFEKPPMASPVLPPRKPMLRLRFRNRPTREMACWTYKVSWPSDAYWPESARAVLISNGDVKPASGPADPKGCTIDVPGPRSEDRKEKKPALVSGSSFMVGHLPEQQAASAHCTRVCRAKNVEEATHELFFELFKQRFMGRNETLLELLELLEHSDAGTGEPLTMAERKRNQWICRQLRLALAPLPDLTKPAGGKGCIGLVNATHPPLNKQRESNISGRWKPIGE